MHSHTSLTFHGSPGRHNSKVISPVSSEETSSGGNQRAKTHSQGSRANRKEVRELLAQVGRDLEPWRESGITLEMVEKNYCTEAIDWSMRIQVVALCLIQIRGLKLVPHVQCTISSILSAPHNAGVQKSRVGGLSLEPKVWQL